MAEGKRSSKVKGVARNITGPWRIIFIIALVALLVTIIVVTKNIISLRIEKGNLEAQEQELQNKKEELTAELQGVNDMDYIEEQARKLLKMIKPGEVLYILNGEDPSPETSQSGETLIPAPENTAPAGTTSEPTEETETSESAEESYVEESTEEVTQENTAGEGESQETEWQEETATEEGTTGEESTEEG